MKKLILLSITALALCISCKKDDDDPAPYQVNVNSYTTTDASGNLLGQVDITDWTSDATWVSEETALMQTPTAAQLSGAASGTIQMFNAYPNPFSSSFILPVNSSSNCLMQLVITDNLLNVKGRFFHAIDNDANLINVIPDAAQLNNNTNYRVHYAFYNSAGSIFYKGHGDVRVQR